MKIRCISYKYGLINKPSHKKKLKARHLEEKSIPNELVKLIEEKDILSIKGTLGSKEGAAPIEYEEVKIRTDEKETVFEVYNKGLSIFANETAELKRVFEFCCKLKVELRL